jgi:hypothetical protein
MVKFICVSYEQEFTEVSVKPQKKKTEELDPEKNSLYENDDLLTLLKTKIKNKGTGSLVNVLIIPLNGEFIYVWGYMSGKNKHPEYVVKDMPINLFDDIILVQCETNQTFLYKNLRDLSLENAKIVFSEVLSTSVVVSDDEEDEEDEEDKGEDDDEDDEQDDDNDDNRTVEGEEDDDLEEEEFEECTEEVSDCLVNIDLFLDFEQYKYPADLSERSSLPLIGK